MNYRKHDLDTKGLEAKGYRVLEDAALLSNMQNEGNRIFTVVSFKELPFPTINDLVSVPVNPAFQIITIEEVKRQKNRTVGKVIGFPDYGKALVRTFFGELNILLNDIVLLENRKIV